MPRPCAPTHRVGFPSPRRGRGLPSPRRVTKDNYRERNGLGRGAGPKDWVGDPEW